MSNYKSIKKETNIRDIGILRKIVTLINIESQQLNDVNYKRLLSRIIKRLYALKNIEYVKKHSASDIKSQDNPQSNGKHYRLNRKTATIWIQPK